MRARVQICWIFVLRSTLAASFLHVEDHRVDRVDRSLADGSASKLVDTWTSVFIRGKRNDEEETVPTRHAKHRKRRRCRNRSCSRGTTGLFSSRANETGTQDQNAKEDRDAANTVSEIEEDPREKLLFGAVQDLYNETRGEDYEATESEEGEITGKRGTTQENVSIVDDLSPSKLIDSYDERAVSEEIKLENKNLPSWMKARLKDEANDYVDEDPPSTVYTAVEDQVSLHESLGVLMSKLFQSLRYVSSTESRDIFRELNYVNATNEDPCQKWLNSRDKIEKVFLGGLASLAACPCQYPSNIFYDDKIWDENQKKHFRWRDVSGNSQRLDVYKPGAAYCVRSLLTQGSGSAAAQHCCYDRRRKLLTRGSGAGTPNFVSPEISPILHERIDVLPWRLCKGDFSRYNGVRPPNNDNNCEANPDNEEYQRQIDDTKYY